MWATFFVKTASSVIPPWISWGDYSEASCFIWKLPYCCINEPHAWCWLVNPIPYSGTVAKIIKLFILKLINGWNDSSWKQWGTESWQHFDDEILAAVLLVESWLWAMLFPPFLFSEDISSWFTPWPVFLKSLANGFEPTSTAKNSDFVCTSNGLF